MSVSSAVNHKTCQWLKHWHQHGLKVPVSLDFKCQNWSSLVLSCSTLKSTYSMPTYLCSLNYSLLLSYSLNIGLFLCAATELIQSLNHRKNSEKCYCFLFNKNCGMWVRSAWTCETGPSKCSIRCVRRDSPCLAFFFQPSAILPDSRDKKPCLWSATGL